MGVATLVKKLGEHPLVNAWLYKVEPPFPWRDLVVCDDVVVGTTEGFADHVVTLVYSRMPSPEPKTVIVPVSADGERIYHSQIWGGETPEEALEQAGYTVSS